MQDLPHCPFCLREYASIKQITEHLIHDRCRPNHNVAEWQVQASDTEPVVGFIAQNSTSIPQQTLINHDIV